jgi:hypothetical protein
MKALAALGRLDLGAHAAPAPSPGRFADGGAFRIEIPSVEGPEAMTAVLDAARVEGVTVNRISQGSGAALLREHEVREMAALATGAGLDLALFIGPRAGFDTGAFSRSSAGAGQYGALRGLRQLAYAVEDVQRAVECGIRSFLVADLGLLSVLTRLRAAGELPADCLWKVSAYMAPSNPATLRVLEELGAGTINVPTDLSATELAELRAHCSLPIDLYLEAPDGMGGIVRGHELGELVAAGAPLYAKFGLRNARPTYPGGAHLTADAALMGRERVHRAAVALEWLARTHPELPQSPARVPATT